MYDIQNLFATENSNRYLVKVGQTDRSSKNQTEPNSNKKLELKKKKFVNPKKNSNIVVTCKTFQTKIFPSV